MRARLRYLVVSFVAAVAVALTGQTVAPVTAAIACPASTSWDNILQRCV